MTNEPTSHRYIWTISSVTSVLLLIALIIVWCKAYYYPNLSQTVVLRSNADVQTYLQNTWLKRYTLKPPIFIPTGIYITNLSFKSAKDLDVSLVVWQRYATDIPPKIQKVYYLLEQVEFAQQFLLFDEIHHGEEIKVDYVQTTIRQQFDEKKYPFDDKIVFISLWPKNHLENVIFVPDFSSYTPRQVLIGVDHYIRLRDFMMRDSYFGYKPSDYDTNFGIKNSIDAYGYPYFYYALVLKRAFSSAFVWHVLPLLIAYILMFSILMMSHEEKRSFSRFKFTGTMIVANCIAVFFVLIIIHIGMDSKLHSKGVIYLEYFYLLLYFLILFIVANNYILLGDKKQKVKWIHYENNLIPKILYWPVVLLFALIVSIFVLL